METSFQGDWTLEKIAAAVKNNLEAGLKQGVNFPFSMEQLEHEIISTRNALYQQANINGVLNITPFIQHINCIPVDCEQLSLCCSDNTLTTSRHFVLPHYIGKPIFIGTPNRNIEFKIYKDESHYNNKHRNKLVRNRPYVWLRQHQGDTHGFIFNPPTDVLERISVSLVLVNPYEVNRYSCCQLNPRTDKFPASPDFIQLIIDTITNKWSSWYYRFNSYKANS